MTPPVPGSTVPSGLERIAAHSHPSTMPVPLLRAHQDLDRAVDRSYRPESFPSDRYRLEYLLALYEKLTGPLVAAPKPGRKLSTAS